MPYQYKIACSPPLIEWRSTDPPFPYIGDVQSEAGEQSATAKLPQSWLHNRLEGWEVRVRS
jgi:hypothetical protein